MEDNSQSKKVAGRKKSGTAAFRSKNADAFAAAFGRELPYNVDAEEGILASILRDSTSGDVMTACVSSKLREDYFFKPAHRIMYSAMLALYNDKHEIDEIVLAEYLHKRGKLEDVGGVVEINRIIGRIETPAHFREWLSIVREKYFLRTLIYACAEAIDGAYQSAGNIESYIGKVEEKILAISQDRVGDSVRKADAPDQVDAAVERINMLIKNKGAMEGVATGFVDLDRLMGGLHSNEMIVIAGRPGTGKTSIALNIAENALFAPTPVPTLIFSLEMLAPQLHQRIIASRARIDQHKLSKGLVPKDTSLDIATTAKELKNSPLWIDDTADVTILEMRAKARRLNQQLQRDGQKLGLIIVDYLQLLRGSDSSMPREQQVSEISRGMKAMAKELLVPVIVLAQLNRESEKGEMRNPRASDLRESGSIEQDADAIILLSRKRKSASDDESTNSSQWLIRTELAKNRNGPTEAITLLFNRNYTRYDNYTSREDVPNV